MSSVAGSFYPAEPETLIAMIDQMLAQTTGTTIHDDIYAIVAPHAGYPYSGPVAAYAYSALKKHRYSRVAILAPSHFEPFDFTSVYSSGSYETPLGSIPVDHSFAQALTSGARTIKLSTLGHRPTPRGSEHAIEVQLPWLQHILGNFSLVPVVIGSQTYSHMRELGLALARLIQDRDTLIVASSDLSHYHTYEEARKLDHKTLSALESWDYISMSRNFESRIWEACGGGPIIAAMIAAEQMGADHAELLHYANSGDVTGEHSRVVGYSAVALVRQSQPDIEEQQFSLSEDEKNELLALAKRAVEHAIRDKHHYTPRESENPSLTQERGAFVTLKKNGILRGCIGYASPMKPLSITIRDAALLAALRDPRFPPVSIDELEELEYDLSVLSPLRRVADPSKIVVGRDGLFIKNGDHEGLLLPQVPIEQQWTREMFLAQTCVKAKLPPDCWKSEDTDIFAFSAVVFGDKQQEVGATIAVEELKQ